MATKTKSKPAKADDGNGNGQKALVKYEPNAVVGNQGVLKGLLETDAMQEAMRDLAPKHLKPEKLARMILSAASRNPTLLQCTQASILKSAIEATMLGLDCSGLLGRGYMIPYKNNRIGAYEAQFMAGYLGLVDLARRSGEIVDINAVPVYEGDEFAYEEGLNRRLVHKPTCDPTQQKDEKSLLWVYAVAEFKSGYKKFLVMSKPEVDSHRARSRASSSGPWVTDYVAMALKTVVRQLCKFLPQSVDLASQLSTEYEIDGDEMFAGARHIEAHELKPTNGERQPFGFNGEQQQEPTAEPEPQQTPDENPQETEPDAEAKAEPDGPTGPDWPAEDAQETEAPKTTDAPKPLSYKCGKCGATFRQELDQCPACSSSKVEAA